MTKCSSCGKRFDSLLEGRSLTLSPTCGRCTAEEEEREAQREFRREMRARTTNHTSSSYSRSEPDWKDLTPEKQLSKVKYDIAYTVFHFSCGIPIVLFLMWLDDPLFGALANLFVLVGMLMAGTILAFHAWRYHSIDKSELQ